MWYETVAGSSPVVVATSRPLLPGRATLAASTLFAPWARSQRGAVRNRV